MEDQIAARNARADRIHALYRRASLKFRDAYFAYRLLDDRIEGMDRHTEAYKKASALKHRAIDSMEHWNARSRHLGRAEVRTVLGMPQL